MAMGTFIQANPWNMLAHSECSMKILVLIIIVDFYSPFPLKLK